MLLTLSTQVLLGLKLEFHPYLFIIFFATFFEYNLHRFIPFFKYRNRIIDHKYDWVKRNTSLFHFLVLVSAIGFLIAIYFAQKEVLLVLTPIAVITFFYSIPLFKSKNRWVRLRDIPYLKLFLIATVWSSATILLPVIHAPIKFASGNVYLMLLERFFFILAITIPFDIRDMQTDQQLGLKTLPHLLKPTQSYQLAILCMVIFWLVSVLHYTILNNQFILIPISLSAISTIYFLSSRKIRQHTLYHYGILDGTMIIQGLMIVLVQLCK
ncbi:MAG: UbiA family prenyltransferase [Bacteroidota bacterium]|nr:UbiA family prenyltransferase [Bacteroidota bacterium]